MSTKQPKVRVATISEIPSNTFRVNIIYKDEIANTSISSDESGRINALKTIKGKKVRKREPDTKDSRNKKVLCDLPEFAPLEDQSYLYGRLYLDDQMEQLVERNNDMAAEEEKDDLKKKTLLLI